MKRRELLLLSLLALGGCAPYVAPTRTFAGAFSLRYQEGGKWKNQQGKYTLRVWADKEVLDIRSPLGVTVATLTMTPTGNTLAVMGQEPITGNNPDELIAQVLSEPIPVKALLAWFETENPQAQNGWEPTVSLGATGSKVWQRLRVKNQARHLHLTITQ